MCLPCNWLIEIFPGNKLFPFHTAVLASSFAWVLTGLTGNCWFLGGATWHSGNPSGILYQIHKLLTWPWFHTPVFKLERPSCPHIQFERMTVLIVFSISHAAVLVLFGDGLPPSVDCPHLLTNGTITKWARAEALISTCEHLLPNLDLCHQRKSRPGSVCWRGLRKPLMEKCQIVLGEAIPEREPSAHLPVAYRCMRQAQICIITQSTHKYISYNKVFKTARFQEWLITHRQLSNTHSHSLYISTDNRTSHYIVACIGVFFLIQGFGGWLWSFPLGLP